MNELEKQSTVHGNINNINLGASFERIVIYICLTILGSYWLG